MNEEKEIERAQKEAYSIESMAAHGAGGRSITYIGSIDYGNRLSDFYRDEAGMYWFRERIRLQNGLVVTLEEAVFGRKLERRKGKRNG